MAKKPKRHVIADRIGDLERDAESRLPGSAHERVELWSWVPIPEREALEIELETAPDGSDAELAALLRAEAALLTAQGRRDAGWPAGWWWNQEEWPAPATGKESWR